MPPRSDESEANLQEQARRALRDGRLDEARRLAEAALEATDGSRAREVGVILSLLGEVDLRRGRWRDALERLEEAYRLAPHPWAAALIIRALFRGGDWEGGVTRCRGFLRTYPESVFLRTLEARYLLHSGEVDAATGRLEEIVRDEPDNAYAKSLLVEARTGEAPPEERVRELEGLFRIESRRNDPQLRYTQARNRIAAGDLEGACEELAAAVALAPSNKFFRSQLAFTLKKAGRVDEALPLLRELFLEDPSDRYVRSSFQSACRVAGRMSTLRETVRVALERHPEKKFLHGMLRKGKGDEKG